MTRNVGSRKQKINSRPKNINYLLMERISVLLLNFLLLWLFEFTLLSLVNSFTSMMKIKESENVLFLNFLVVN